MIKALEGFRRASIPRLCGAPAPHLEDVPSRRGRRSHGRSSGLPIWGCCA